MGILECSIYFWVSLCLGSPGLSGLSQYSGIHVNSVNTGLTKASLALVIVHAHGCPFLELPILIKLQTHKDSSPREGQPCFRLVSLLKWNGSSRTVTFSGSCPAQEACSGSYHCFKVCMATIRLKEISVTQHSAGSSESHEM